MMKQPAAGDRRKLEDRNRIHYTSVSSPLGELWLAATPQGICRLSYGPAVPRWVVLLREENSLAPSADHRLLSEAREQLAEYFEGSRRSFELPLDLSCGSSFQRRVWEATSHIPYGQVRSYGQIARALASAGSARAVGRALGRNPVPIIVPCHRVTRTDGTLGGYSGGPHIKRALLAIEGCARP